MNIVRIVIALLIVITVVVLFVRFYVPFARRATAQRTPTPVVVPGEVVPDHNGFPRASRHGYDTEDVEALFDRVYALAATPSGRPAALEAVRSARFHLDRKGGYDPIFVDDRMDALADALSVGRALPPRPGWR